MESRFQELVDQVLVEITDDVRMGKVPWTVNQFRQLHDWVDANDYVAHASRRLHVAVPDSLAEVNALEGEVSRLLGAGAVTGGGWRKLSWTVRHSLVLPVALLRDPRGDGASTVSGVDAVIAEFESDLTVDTLGGRTVNRVERHDPPAYRGSAARDRADSALDDLRRRLRRALVALRSLDATVARLEEQHFNDGFENPQDEIIELANDQAREALRLTLLGMAPGS